MPQVPKRVEVNVLPGGGPSFGAGGGPARDLVGIGAARSGFGAEKDVLNSALDLVAKSESQKIELANRAKNMMDTIVVTDAGNKRSAVSNKIMSDVREMRGKDAKDAVIYADIQWKKGLDDIRKDFFNPEQELAFEMASNRDYTQLNQQVFQHVGKELDFYSQGVMEANVTLAQEKIADNYNNPVIVQQGFDELSDAVFKEVSRRGGNENIFEAELLKKRSQSQLKTIQMMYADDEPELARAYLKKNEKPMHSDDVLKAKAEDRQYNRQQKERTIGKKRQWYVDVMDGALDSDGLDDLLKSDPDMTISFYEKMKKELNDPYFDKYPDPVRNSEALYEVLAKLDSLHGIKFNEENTKIIQMADGNTLDDLLAAQDYILERTRNIGKAMTDSSLNAIRTDINNDGMVKKNIFKNYLNALQNTYSFLPFVKGPDEIAVPVAVDAITINNMNNYLIEGFSAIMNPDISVEEAEEERKRITRNAVVDRSPEEVVHKKGGIYERNGRSLYCTGINEKTGKAEFIPYTGQKQDVGQDR